MEVDAGARVNLVPTAGQRMRACGTLWASKMRRGGRGFEGGWFTMNPLRQIRFSFDGHTHIVDGPLTQRTSVRVEDIGEIGVETTDSGPFVEDVFWLINRDTDGLRIPQDSPVFKELMDTFGSFRGFDWHPFFDAMACTDRRYFLCWRRPHESAKQVHFSEPGRGDLYRTSVPPGPGH